MSAAPLVNRIDSGFGKQKKSLARVVEHDSHRRATHGLCTRAAVPSKMATQSHEPRLSARAPIGLAMATVILSFLATLWISHSPTRSIDSEVGTIARNAAPAMEHLSNARTELRRMHLLANQHIREPGSEDEIHALMKAIDRELAAFERMRPANERKQQFESAIEEELPAVEGALDRALTAARSADPTRADQVLHDHLQPALDVLDDRLADAQLAITQLVQNRAYEIAEAGRHSQNLALLLGGLSVVAAIGAGAFALHALRRQANVIVEHSRMIEERAKDLEAFAGRVAHDLRNPLAALMLRIETLRAREYDDPTLSRSLEKLEAQGQRMDRVIDGLLGFAVAGAQIETGASSDVAEVIDGIVNDLRPVAEKTQTTLVAETAADLEVACMPGALTSALTNLVGNALKYIVDGTAPERRVTIRALQRDDVVRIEVEDNGPGLRPGVETAIFEPFRRATSGRQPGLGIGLATVKRIADAHHGRVGVINRPGAGATFWIELPRAA
jgi:signal transduction histidine kinase